MTSNINNNHSPSQLVRECIGYPVLRNAAISLMQGGVGLEDWKSLADQFGYSVSDIQCFELEKQDAAHKMLLTWSNRPNTTISVLKKALSNIKREDVLEIITKGHKYFLEANLTNIDGTKLLNFHQTFENDATLRGVLIPALAEKGFHENDLVIIGPKMNGPPLTWNTPAGSTRGQIIEIQTKFNNIQSYIAKKPDNDLTISVASSPSLPPPYSDLGPQHIAKRVPDDAVDPYCISDIVPASEIVVAQNTEPYLISPVKYETEVDDYSAVPLENAIQPSASNDFSSLSRSIPSSFQDDTYEVPVLGWVNGLQNEKRAIRHVMRAHLREDGWYIVRPLEQNRIAVSVTHMSEILHFKIHQKLVAGRNQFYFFKQEYQAFSVPDLVRYYSQHDLQSRQAQSGHIRLKKPIVDSKSQKADFV